MENLKRQNDVALYSPLTLAYLGDAVFELLVRDYLVKQGNANSKNLHKRAVQYVSCKAQSISADLLLPLFSDGEKAVYMRGRNANQGSISKNVDRAEYHKSTALEAVFGYLHLKNENERIVELFNKIINNQN